MTDALRSKASPASLENAFSLNDGDRINFLSDDECEVCRGDKPLGRYRYRWDDRLSKAVERTQMALVPGMEAKVAGPDETSMGKPSEAPKAKAPKKQPEQPQTGERWITIHPSKEDPTHYLRVKIRVNPDGTGSVIGGAGGKLNQLRLTKLKSPKEWKENAAKRKALRKEKERKRQEAQSQDEREAEEGALNEARQYHRGERHSNALATLEAMQEVGIEHGLSEDHLQALQAPLEDADPEAAKQVEAMAKEAVKKAEAIQKAYEQRLVTDHEARAAALMDDTPLGLGNPLQNGVDHAAYQGNETISNLVALPNGQWLVQSDQAADQTFDDWQDAAKAHVANVAQHDATTGDRSQPEDFYNPRLWVQGNDAIPFDPAIAGKVAALAQQRKDIDRSSKAAEAAIKKKMPWSAKKGYDVGAVTELDEQSAIASLEQDAKTIEDAIVHGRLLDMAGLLDASAMARDLKVGGMAQLGEIASDVLKVDVLDPAIVDALGHDEAAKLIAYQIKAGVTDKEYAAIVAQHQAHHAEWSTRYAQQVIDQNQPLMDKLQQIHGRMLEIEAAKGDDYTPDQLMELDSLSYQSERLQASLSSAIGTALGQLQASAALSLALESGPRSLRFAATSPTGELADVPGLLSPKSDGQPSIWAAYGLDAEDFSIEDGPDGQLVTLKSSGMEKIAKATYDPEDRQAYEEAIAIKRGDYDEEDFVPAGFAYRPEQTFADFRAEAQQFNTQFDYQPSMADEDVEASIKQYLGARVANGDNPMTVRNDLLSAEFKVNLGLSDGDRDRVEQAINRLDSAMFGKDAPGQGQIRDAYEALANAEAGRQRTIRQTDDTEALHSQSLDADTAVEAAHRTLAAMPMARAALKPMDQLSHEERKYLRDYAITEIMGDQLEAPAKDDVKGADPEVEYLGLFSGFGDLSQPEGDATITRAPTQWEKFSQIMGGDEKAYEAVRDRIKGTFYNRFASAYGAIEQKPLMASKQKIAHVERLAAAQLPEEDREEFLAHLRSISQSEMAGARARQGGKFVAEVDDWLERYNKIKGKNRQISLFMAETMEQGSPLEWQRTTLGTQAEADIDAAIASVAGGFDQIGNAVNIYPEVKFNGGFVAHQRALKFLEARRAIGLHMSAGAGKSSAMIAAFSHLHGQGKVTRSIVAVPSGVLGQIVGECATFLKPGQYNYSANMNWSKEERLRALTDNDTHLHFTTRESLAGDILHLVEQHTGVSAEDFQDVDARSEDDRRELVGKALQAAGIDASKLLFSVDEAHDLSRRQGVNPSRRSLVLDALAHHSSHYIHATGTPLKNDASEIADFLQKLGAPEVKDISKFMARYGKNTVASQRSLQRLMAKYAYAVAVKPTTKDGVPLEVRHEKPRVSLTDHQKTRRSEIQKHYDTIRQWKQANLSKVMAAKVERGEPARVTAKDLAHAWEDEGVRAAVQALANESYGKLPEEEKQARIGGQIMGASMLKYTAMNRLYHDTPYEQNGKAQHLVELAGQLKEQGKPAVIFAASTQAAKMLQAELAKRGHRVGYIDGATMDASQKDAERLKFSPAAGSGEEPQTDILICTDAAQTGLNLQRGKALIHYDIPMTQKAWDQRTARIYRRGQTEDVDVHTLVADAPEDEIALARMERKGTEAELFQGHNEALGHSEVLDDTGLAYEIAQMRSHLDDDDQPLPMAA